MRNKHQAESRRGGRSILVRIFTIFALICGFFVLHPHESASAAAVSPTAINVYGQGGSFTNNTVNNGGITESSLNAAGYMALDSSGNLYISDTSNNRVLFYPSGSTVATRVYGQGGSFTVATANNGGISANSLSGPQAIDLDASNNLYITDTGNNRVLFYLSGSTTATRVYGQGGSFTTGTANKGGISANSLSSPRGVKVDSSNNLLYISDSGNNRVLVFSGTSTTATTVYGQGGVFTTATVNKGGRSATSLSSPRSTALDSSHHLYVADTANNRVLFYPNGSTTATRVYGQGGSFTTGTANNGGISATSLSGPQSVIVDDSDNLYVADTANNRVLFYPNGSTTATRVYGQDGSFTTADTGNLTATGLDQPSGIELNNNGGDIYIADAGNSRVLQFLNILQVSTQPPATIAANTQFTVASEMIDLGSGSAFSDFTGTVTIQITPGTGTSGAALSGTTSVAAIAGVATFSNLAIDMAGNCYVLTLSSPGITSTQTNPFSVTGPVPPTICPLTSTGTPTPCTHSICLVTNGGTVTVTGTPTLVVNNGQTIPVSEQDQFIPFTFLAKISDTRGNGHGWTTAASATTISFPAGGTADLVLDSTSPIVVTCAGGSTCSSPSSLTLGSGGQDLVPGPVTLATASFGAGMGAYNITTTGTFLVPANVDANGYTGGVVSMTITANP